MIPSPAPSLSPRAFSLAEVAISVAILALSLTTLLGLIPSAMNNMRLASNMTAEARIVSEITGAIELADWGSPAAAPYHWSNLPAVLSNRWYFDDQCNPIDASSSGFDLRLSYIATAQLAETATPAGAGQVIVPADGAGSLPATTNAKAIHVRIASTNNTGFAFTNPAQYTTCLALIARQF